MGEKSASGEPNEHPPPQGEQARFQDAFELLNARRYKHVERLLQVQQEAAQRSGQMALVVILATASQLCLTCRQFQADKELHQLGLEEATRRERESQLQIQTVLTMLSQLTSLETRMKVETTPDLLLARSETVEPEETESGKPPTLIQKVKQLLGFEPTSPSDKSTVSVDREDQEPETSPYDQIDSSIALQYLAHELEMLEKTGASLSPEQKLLQAVAASLTASSQQGDDTLEAIAFKTHAVGYQQVAAESLKEEGSSEENDRLPDQKDLLTTINEEEEPMLDGEPSVMQISNQTQPMESPMMSHVRPEDVSADEDMGSPSLVVYCLGPFQVYSNEKPIDKWPSSKGKSIFKYLINNRERPIAKEVLMDLFWPEADPDAARNNLNVAIYGLRQAFRNGDTDYSHVLYENEHYLLNPELQVWLDVEEFMTHFQNGQKLQREGLDSEAAQEYHVAEALYQGEFLEEDRYEEWLMPLRQQLTSSYLELLEHLSQYYFDKREYTSCITICRSVLSIDPCLEDTHGRLMRCHYRQGQQHLALRQYHRCVKALKEELEMAPGPSIEELYKKVRHQEAI